MASSLVISIADANDALEVIEVGLSGVEETNHDEVVGSDSGESSSGGGVVVGDWDVALSIVLLVQRLRVVILLYQPPSTSYTPRTTCFFSRNVQNAILLTNRMRIHTPANRIRILISANQRSS